MLRRRWVALGALVIVLVAAFARLGFWQLDRLHQRRAVSARVTANLQRAPEPAAAVLATGRRPDADAEWRPVRASGQYETGAQLLVRNRPLEGRTGSHVLVPLRTAQGPLLLVDRGWVPAAASAAMAADVPPPPPGEVTVTGRVRVGEQVSDPGRLGRADAPQPSVLRLDPVRIGASLELPTYGGYVELVEESPTVSPAPRLLPPPDLAVGAVGQGANLSYALQWFLFAVTAVVGFFVLARREWHEDAYRDAGRDADRAPSGIAE